MLAIIFGPRTPTQVRDLIYLFITGGKFLPFKDWLAKWTALGIYLWAVVIFLLSPLLLVAAVIANEFIVNGYPESESHVHIGAWSPYVGTILVLIASFIAQFKSWQAVEAKRKKEHITNSDKTCSRMSAVYRAVILYPFALINKILILHPQQKCAAFWKYVKHEFKNTKDFYKNPDRYAKRTNRDGIEIPRKYQLPGQDSVRGAYSEPYLDQDSSYSHSTIVSSEIAMSSFSPSNTPYMYSKVPLISQRSASYN
ncbi:MAG: hypothetical protein MMC33_010591 [Icmadophila ericetorum]|nr:hypothetical protein [Icmadophila ericetorum]